GGIVSGIAHVFRSSYLLSICAFMFLYAITTTFIYFQMADVTAHQFHDRAARTVFFAHLDVWVNFLTVLVQIFLTGRLLKWFGVGLTGISFVAAPLAAVWCALSIWLGRRQRALAAQRESSA